MADIFISYKRERKETASALASLLEDHGWTVWWDAALVGGEIFREEIERELTAARAVVTLWCEDSIRSRWVVDESEAGMERGAYLPALIQPVRPPLGLRGFQALDLIGWRSGSSPQIEKLISRLEGLIGTPDCPTGEMIGRDAVEHAKSTSLPGIEAPASESLLAPPETSEIAQHYAIQLERALHRTAGFHSRLDLNALHADVRHVAEQAREAEFVAITHQFHARDAAFKADEVRQRAMSGGAGTRIMDGPSRKFETEILSDIPHGYGRLTFTGGDFKGDIYRGQWTEGQFNGLGVYRYGRNPNNRSNALRYDGQHLRDRSSGHGVFIWRDGDVFAGEYEDDERNGLGVLRYSDGRRIEGEYADGKLNGFGVCWSAVGRVTHAGIWRDGELVRPIFR